jgi:hypothetical protein
VDAQTVAEHLGISRDTVYSHATELGGRRVGDGPRPRLRFDLVAACAAWQPLADVPPPTCAPPRRRRSSTHGNLLPVIEQ